MNRIYLQAQRKGGKLVFLIDEFDHWRSAEAWLIPFLAQLKLDVRVITVGRHPLTGGWLRAGYTNFTYSLELSTLSPVEVAQYAKKRELGDKALQTQIFQFSRGVPLAMVLAAEVMLQGEGQEEMNRQKQVMLTGVMMEQVLQGLPSSLQRIMEASSVYWSFNEERLAAVIDEEIDLEAFRRFTSLPFVIWKEDGWMLHDAVRAWSLEDLQLRKPNHFEQMRRKALEQIRLEERLNPEQRGSLQVEKMNLHENPLVRHICFSGHIEDVELSECRESDMLKMQSLYIRYHQFVFPGNPEERHMEQLIRPIWEVEPSSFLTIRQKGKLIAFYGMIPLNENILRVLAKEPLFHPFIKGWQSHPNAFLLSFIAIEPELEEKTRGYIIHTIINYLSQSERILIFTCLKDWFPVYELYGFEPITWADTLSVHGTVYRAFALDLSEEDFLSKMDRAFSMGPKKENKTRGISTMEAIPKLKMILKEWGNLPGDSTLYKTYFQLFPNRMKMTDVAKEMKGHLVQQDLMASIHSLTEGDNDRERAYGKLLKSIYIQKIRPHERVAERLNLSMATYYRYLNKALERLVQMLRNGK